MLLNLWRERTTGPEMKIAVIFHHFILVHLSNQTVIVGTLILVIFWSFSICCNLYIKALL